jgi:hypothetical protein
MDKNPLNFIKAFEGLGETGEPKAIAVLQNQTYTMALEGASTPRVHDQAATAYATLKFAIYNGLLSATLIFEDFEDEDYLRFKSVCTHMTMDVGESGEASDGLEHHLVLTITDKVSHDYFMTCFLLTYAFDGIKPSVTFVCKLDDAIMYQLPENIKNQIIDKLDEQEENTDNNSDLEMV